jgi:hypothetical protein
MKKVLYVLVSLCLLAILGGCGVPTDPVNVRISNTTAADSFNVTIKTSSFPNVNPGVTTPYTSLEMQKQVFGFYVNVERIGSVKFTYSSVLPVTQFHGYTLQISDNGSGGYIFTQLDDGEI